MKYWQKGLVVIGLLILGFWFATQLQLLGATLAWGGAIYCDVSIDITE